MPFDGTKTEQDLNLDLLCADILAAERFTLTIYTHPCGTPACIAGHAGARWPNMIHPLYNIFWELFAGKIGVPQNGLEILCYGFSRLPEHGPHFAAVTPRMAVAALRRLRATGEAYYDLADDVEGAA